MLPHMSRKLLLFLLMPLFAVSVRAADTKVLANVRADAVYLEPVTNSAGTITFFAWNGINYKIQAMTSSGQLVNHQFFYDDQTVSKAETVARYLSLSEIEHDIEFTHRVGYGEFGLVGGTLHVKRSAGFAVGTYDLTGTPIGDISGRFHVVEFRGILTYTPLGYIGTLTQQNPYPGVPDQFILGPSTNDDVMGTEVGRNYGAGFSSGQFLITENTRDVKAYTFLRGTAVELASVQGGSGSLIELQASDSVTGPWLTFATFPAPTNRPMQVFRLKITK